MTFIDGLYIFLAPETKEEANVSQQNKNKKWKNIFLTFSS